MIERKAKVLMVKHGNNLREVSRVHIKRLRGINNEVNEEVERKRLIIWMWIWKG